MSATCSDCPARWTSLAEAHCSICHRHFANLTAFGSHRPSRRGCGDPVNAGLIEQRGVWATPEGHVSRARNAERMRRVRDSRRPLHAQSDEHGQRV